MSVKKKQIHPTNSFAQMMSQSQLNALKPFIQQEVTNSAYGLYRALLKAMTDSQAAVQTRLMALERILSNQGLLKEEDIAMTVAIIEDEILGYEVVTSATTEGDRVRISIRTRAKGTETWSKTDKLVINSLCEKNKDGNTQTLNELEAGLLGVTPEQTVLIEIPPERDGVASEIEATVVRISRKTTKEA